MCIVIGVVDEEDSRYSSEAIHQISVADLQLPPKDEEEKFKGYVFGYPMKYIE